MEKQEEETLNTLAQAEDFLFDTLGKYKQKKLVDGDILSRTSEFLTYLSSPQESFKAIHIAGTSGKGSTGVYLSTLLSAHGFHVGTHLSPHVYDFRERAMIDGKLPDEKRFVDILNSMIPTIRAMSDSSEHGCPSYFEVGLGQAFTLFAQEKIDYGVIETGIGGLYDGTNTIKRGDKLAVITKIGMDHTDILGKTLPEIAKQKAGIISAHGRGIYLKPKNKKVEEAITETAQKRFATITAIEPDKLLDNVSVTEGKLRFDYKSQTLHIKNVELPTPAVYQAENACMAIAALETLAMRDGFEVIEKKVLEAFAKSMVPGRMEVRKIRDHQIILDGAHNEQKMEALVESLKNMGLKQKPIWILAFKKDKDVAGMLKIIKPEVDKLITTRFFAAEKLPHVKGMAMPANTVAANAKEIGIEVVSALADVNEALENAIKIATSDQTIVVSGSMYLLGEIKN